MKEKHVEGGYIKNFMNIIIYFSMISQKHAIFFCTRFWVSSVSQELFRSLATKRLTWEGGPFNNLPHPFSYIFLYSVTVWSTPSPAPPTHPHISPAAEVKKDAWLASKLTTICCRNSSFGFKALSWKYKCWVGIKIYGFGMEPIRGVYGLRQFLDDGGHFFLIALSSAVPFPSTTTTVV